MLELSLICVTVSGLYEWKGICAGFVIVCYICIAVSIIGVPIIKRGGWDPIYRFNSATLFLPVPRQDIQHFQHHISWYIAAQIWKIYDLKTEIVRLS
jgi:hypothetical protein